MRESLDSGTKQSAISACLLAGALLPSLAGCSKGGGNSQIEPPIHTVSLTRYSSVPGPFAPELLNFFVDNSPYLNSLGLYLPGQETTSSPSFVYTPNTSVLLSIPGSYTASLFDDSNRRTDFSFPVQHEFNAFLNINAGSSILGVGTASFSLTDNLHNTIQDWELRAFSFNPSTLQFENREFSSTQGNVSSLKSSTGTISFDLATIQELPSDNVIYIQGSSDNNLDVSSCVFSPIFIPYQGIPTLPPLGIDLGEGNTTKRQGESLALRLHGVDSGALIRMKPILTGQNLVDITVPPTSLTLQTVQIQIPNLGISSPTLWHLDIVVSRSDGTREYQAIIPILPPL